MELYQRVREVIKKEKLTTKEFSNEICVPEHTVNAFLERKGQASSGFLEKIAEKWPAHALFLLGIGELSGDNSEEIPILEDYNIKIISHIKENFLKNAVFGLGYGVGIPTGRGLSTVLSNLSGVYYNSSKKNLPELFEKKGIKNNLLLVDNSWILSQDELDLIRAKSINDKFHVIYGTMSKDDFFSRGKDFGIGGYINYCRWSENVYFKDADCDPEKILN